MADSRSILKPVVNRPADPHPAMQHLYSDPDDPIAYMELPNLAAGELVSGSTIDDELDGYRRSVMVVDIECDNAPAGAMAHLHVLASLDGINYSDATENTAEADVYLPSGPGRVVLTNVPAPPTPFRLGLVYWPSAGAGDLGPVRVAYAFYSTVDVPVA